jgi:hypothetical protein
MAKAITLDPKLALFVKIDTGINRAKEYHLFTGACVGGKACTRPTKIGWE